MATRRLRLLLVVGALVALSAPVRPLAAQYSDDDYGSRVFEGESARGRPLDSMPDESRLMDSEPKESIPLDGPVDSRITDSAVGDGAAVDRGPREMIREHGKSAGGALREGEPVDEGGKVESGPHVKRRDKREPGY